MVFFVVIRERFVVVDVSVFFRGNVIALIIVGFMFLVFMGFSGLVKL